jgi:hypothetical protein
VDSLEDRFGSEASETEVTELLKELGRPRAVAASYYPQGQYLIGPGLYPLFRMVIWIVIAAVLGAQLLAWGVGIFIVGESFAVLDLLFSLLESILVSLGWVVLAFVVLQRFDVKPDLEDEPWDPQSLPQINEDDDLKRGELIVGLVFSILILVLVMFFPQWIGFITTPGGEFYPNPVIIQYLGWIKISLLAGIGLDIILLWQRRWTTVARIMKIAVNLLSIAVLTILVQGHNAWLASRGAGGFFDAIELIPELGDWELIGMHGFRLAFVVALIVTIIETIAYFYRLVRAGLRREYSPQGISIEKS